MTAASVIPDIRAACRAHLLAMPLPTFTGAATVSGDTITMPGVDFMASGIGPGSILTVGGVSAGGRKLALQVAGDTIIFAEPVGSSTGPVTVAMGLPELAWEDEGFRPTPGVPHLAETFARTGGKPVLLGGNLRHDLMLTLTLFWPSGQGTIGVESMGGRLLQHFRPGQGVAYGENKAKIASADQKPLLKEPVWTACPVIASMTAWTANR